jgi:phosphoenolpyruvate-protein kinase (PTS system EI component)
MPDNSYQEGVIIGKLMDSFQSNLSVTQSLLSQMVEQQRAFAAHLAQISETQRDLTQKLASLEDLPNDVRERLSESFSTMAATHQRIEKISSDILAGLSNGYLRALREDLTNLEERRTAQIIGSLSDTTQREIDSVSTLIMEGNKEIINSMKESFQGLIWRFSFVFGGLGFFLSALMMFVEWLRRK